MEPLKEFSKTVLTLDNCIIPKERLLNTPSAKDGMSKDVEIDIRIKGCECIQSAGMLLKLPQVSTRLIWAIIGINVLSFTGCNGHCTNLISPFLLCKIHSEIQVLRTLCVFICVFI